MKTLIRLRLFSNIFFALIGCLLCCSCSLLTPAQPTTMHVYTLNTLPQLHLHRKTHVGTLLVTTTGHNLLYATTQMAYTLYPYHIAYFAVNQWAATPAEMLQSLLIQTLQHTHAFHAVVGQPYIGRYDEMLNVEVVELLQDLTPYHTPCLRFTLRVTLSSARTANVIATQQFSVAEPIYSRTPYGGVLAANRALTILLARIAHFSITH